MKKNNLKARSLAAEQRKAYWGMAAGFAVVAGFLALVVFGSPMFSLKQMVLAQTVPETSANGAVIHGEPISADTNAAATGSRPTGVASAAAPTATVPQTTAESDGSKDTYVKAGFDRLAGFKFEVTDDEALGVEDAITASRKISEQIPPAIKALNDKRVAITGFMLPLQVRHGQATAFLILKSQMMCCYGITPKMNEWVTVRTVGKGVKPLMDRPVTVYGTMHVGEIRENKLLAGIYRVDADKMEVQ
jgi:hypothetical protein